MSQKTKRFLSWRYVLLRAACFWFALILADLALVYFFGSQFWSYAGYLFGTNAKITLSVIMFIEGAVLIALGIVWASGAMESRFQGSNIQTNPYFHKDEWKQRGEQTEKQNDVGKILMLTGGPILIASFILVIA